MSYFIPEDYAVPEFIFILWRCSAVFTSLIYITLYIFSKYKTTRWLIFTFSVFTYCFLSTIINESGGSLVRAAFYFIINIGFLSLIEYELSINKRRLIRSFIIAGIIMCSAHYITFIIYRHTFGGMRAGVNRYDSPDAVGSWFLLKHDNGSIFYFLPVLAAIWYYYFKYRISVFIPLITTLATLYMYLYLFSVTALFVILGFTVSVLFIKYKIFNGMIYRISYLNSLAIGVGICSIIVFLATLLSGSSIAIRLSLWSASNFNKAINFGRGLIWNRSISYIINHPFIGMGFEKANIITSHLGINHCHNILIDLIYTGGIIAVTTYLLYIILCNNKNTGAAANYNIIVYISIILFFIASTFDWYIYIPIPLIIFELNKY